MFELVIADIKSKFGLDIINCAPIVGGLEHDTFLVNVAQSCKKVVLRIYRSKTKAMAREEADLLFALHGQVGIDKSIVKMLPGLDSAFIHEVAEMHYCLFEYVDGSHPKQLGGDQLESLIRVIKGIHYYGLDVADKYSSRGLPSGLQMQGVFKLAYAKHDITLRQWMVIQAITEQFDLISKKYLAKTVIHYDVHLPNILISNQTAEPILLDFDDFIVASPIFELAVMARGLCFQDGHFNADLVGTILLQYNLSGSIESRFNAREFVCFILFDLVRVCDACLNRFDGAKKHELFEEHYNKIQYLLQHYKSVVTKLSTFNQSVEDKVVIHGLGKFGLFQNKATKVLLPARSDAEKDWNEVICLLEEMSEVTW